MSSVCCRGWRVETPVESWSPQCMQLSASVTVPAPSPTQVRVKVHAAAVNPVDWKRCVLAPAGLVPRDANKFPFPFTPGCDGAGEVESTGTAVTSFQAGDRVVFHSDISQTFGGALCEYALVEADVLVRLPDGGSAMNEVSFTDAAAVPCATWTAYTALFEKLRIQKGQTILVDGASGGVGSSAVQLAKHAGLRVFASCSPHHAEYVKNLGADVVLDYHDRPAMVAAILGTTDGVGVDTMLAVTDCAAVEASSAAVRFGGAICLLSGLLVPKTPALFVRQLSIHYVFFGGMHGQNWTRPALRHAGEAAMQLYADGAYRLSVEVHPLDAAATLLDRLATGHATCGKLVVTMTG